MHPVENTAIQNNDEPRPPSTPCENGTLNFRTPASFVSVEDEEIANHQQPEYHQGPLILSMHKIWKNPNH